jgi:hypothetical protein
MHASVLIVLRFGVALLVLFGLGAQALSGYADRRFAAVEERVHAQCRAFRKTPGQETATICADDPFAPSGVADWKAAEGHVKDVRALLARGESAGAQAHAEAALQVAAHLDARRRLVGALLAAKIVNEVLDAAEAHPVELGPRALASQVRVWAAEHPLEAVRLDRLYEASRQPERSRLPAPVVKLFIAEWIDREDVKLTEMQRALLADDLPRCERAAQSPLDALLCTKMLDVVRTGRRTAALRARGPR